MNARAFKKEENKRAVNESESSVRVERFDWSSFLLEYLGMFRQAMRAAGRNREDAIYLGDLNYAGWPRLTLSCPFVLCAVIRI